MVLLTLSPLMARRCRRKTFPFASITCQCGSGVPGTSKSSERVGTVFPAFTTMGPVPLFTFEQENGLLTLVTGAGAGAVVSTANAATADSNRLRIVTTP